MPNRVTLTRLVAGMKALGYTHFLADEQLPIDVWAGGYRARYAADTPPRCIRCGNETLLFSPVSMPGGQLRENQVEEGAC